MSIFKIKLPSTLRAFGIKRYAKVCLVGLVCMSIQFIVFNRLRLVIHPVQANALAIELAIITNFFLNNNFSFSDRKLTRTTNKFSTIYRFTQFNVLSFGSIILQSLFLYVGIKLGGRGLVEENILVVLGAILGSIFNYFIYTSVIWKKVPATS